MKQINFDDVKGILRKLEGLLEVFLLSVVYYVIWRVSFNNNEFPPYYGNGKYLLVFVYCFILLTIFSLCECFSFGYLKLTDIVVAQTISLLLTDIITYFQLCLIANRLVKIAPIIIMYVCQVLLAVFLSYTFTRLYHQMYVPRNMLLISGTDTSMDIRLKIDSRAEKYHIGRTVTGDEPLDTILSLIPSYDAVVLNDIPAEKRNDILKYCYENEVRTYQAPKISDLIVRGADEVMLFDTPLLLVKGKGLTISQRIVKRAFDIILSLVALIPFGPIMLIVSALIKEEDGGPVFFRQERITKDGKVFELIKFRSMIVDADKDTTPHSVTEKDPRITKVGRWIRKTRIDEMPQIFNILKGEMSWVGPRPEMIPNVEKYKAKIPEFVLREKVKGGLTGFAQVYGKYNTSPYDKLRLDIMYIENYSLLLDLKLLLMTVRVIFKKESTEGFLASDSLGEKK